MRYKRRGPTTCKATKATLSACRDCQLLRAPRAQQPAVDLLRSKSASSTSFIRLGRVVHHSAPRGQQQRQQLMTGAIGPEFEGFTTGGRGPDKTGGVEEVAADERGSSVDQSRSAQSDNLGGSPGDGNLSASEAEAEANDVSLRAESAGAGLFDSLETAIDSTTPAPSRSSDR
ncbi:unnamed protein product [Sphagnum balticum]